MKNAVVLIGHGSRSKRSAEQFERLVAAFKAHSPDKEVYYGFIELHEPAMEDVIRAAVEKYSEVTVMPVLLFSAAHAREDIPEVIERVKAEYPDKIIRYADVLGAHDKMAELAYTRMCEAVESTNSSNNYKVLMIGRGTSYQPALNDFGSVCGVVQEHYGMSVNKGFIAAAEPHYKVKLQEMIEAGMKNIVLAPYVLFPGVLLKQIKDYTCELQGKFPDVQLACADCLNVDNLLLKVIKGRVEEAEVV